MFRKLIARFKKPATPVNAPYFAAKEAARIATMLAHATGAVDKCVLSSRNGDDAKIMVTQFANLNPFIATPDSIAKALTLTYPELSAVDHLLLLSRLVKRVRRERGEVISDRRSFDRAEKRKQREKLAARSKR
jgi:hypothetical protein